MSNRTVFFTLILLIVNVLACKNEPTAESAATPAPTNAEAPAPADDATTGAASFNYISKEKIVLKDGTEIIFPKEDDKSSIVVYFATPAQSREGATSLSYEGQVQGNRMAASMTQAGLAIVYIEGNAAMQTALGVAKANASEFNMFKADKAAETLKLIVHNYMGKKVLICAAAPVVTEMMNQLTGKSDANVPTTPNRNLYVVTAKAIGDGEVKTVSY